MASNLSEREQLFFNHFKKHKNLTPMDLVNLVKENLPAGKKLPKNIKNSCIVTVKYLGAKIASDGYSINRVSDIGRGNKAIYQLKKVR